jgi:hypothetical protein
MYLEIALMLTKEWSCCNEYGNRRDLQSYALLTNEVTGQDRARHSCCCSATQTAKPGTWLIVQ